MGSQPLPSPKEIGKILTRMNAREYFVGPSLGGLNLPSIQSNLIRVVMIKTIGFNCINNLFLYRKKKIFIFIVCGNYLDEHIIIIKNLIVHKTKIIQQLILTV